MNYLILQYPGHNWVYYQSADKLALAELAVAANSMDANLEDIEIIHLANIRYVSFKSDSLLSFRDLKILSRLSFVFALYSRFDDNLQPIELPVIHYLDPKISTLMKYKGKTNELFTRMMINVALHSTEFDFEESLELLDPVSGKGTTLFEATTFGFNAFGIEIEGNAIQESQTFFKKFMEQERFKHSRSTRVIYKNEDGKPAQITEFRYAKSKEEFKDEESRKHLAMVHGSSKEAHKYFKKERFHFIVGDLPYGIKHGNKGGKVYGSPTRNPADLVSECLPEWKKVLRKGGSIVLAWNSHLINRKKFAKFFEKGGFEVMKEFPYDQFEHRVDSAIKRDLIVARKANG